MDQSISNENLDQTPGPSFTRYQTIGLALFAFSLSAMFVILLPYTLATFVYGKHLGDAPPEIKNLSGPAVMFLWGMTAGAFLLLVQIGLGYLFRWQSVIERLSHWSLVLTILSGICVLGYLYLTISVNMKIIIFAAASLLFGLYHGLITWLLSKQPPGQEPS